MTVPTRRSALSGAASFGLIAKPVAAFARVEHPKIEFSASQAAFGHIVVEYTTRGWAASDKATRHELIIQRDRALRAVLADARFERWMCVLRTPIPQKDGAIDATLAMVGGFRFITPGIGNDRSAPIKTDSELGSSLLALKSPTALMASGSFVIESDGTLAHRFGVGARTYDDADFSSPEFLVNLDNVSPR